MDDERIKYLILDYELTNCRELTNPERQLFRYAYKTGYRSGSVSIREHKLSEEEEILFQQFLAEE